MSPSIPVRTEEQRGQIPQINPLSFKLYPCSLASSLTCAQLKDTRHAGNRDKPRFTQRFRCVTTDDPAVTHLLQHIAQPTEDLCVRLYGFLASGIAEYFLRSAELWLSLQAWHGAPRCGNTTRLCSQGVATYQCVGRAFTSPTQSSPFITVRSSSGCQLTARHVLQLLRLANVDIPRQDAAVLILVAFCWYTEVVSLFVSGKRVDTF